MSQNKCLRCGHVWWSRGAGRDANFISKRCALCRSPYWNSLYVRNISQGRLHPNSSFDVTLLPSHSRGLVQSEIPSAQYTQVVVPCDYFAYKNRLGRVIVEIYEFSAMLEARKSPFVTGVISHIVASTISDAEFFAKRMFSAGEFQPTFAALEDVRSKRPLPLVKISKPVKSRRGLGAVGKARKTKRK